MPVNMESCLPSPSSLFSKKTPLQLPICPCAAQHPSPPAHLPFPLPFTQKYPMIKSNTDEHPIWGKAVKNGGLS